MDAILLIIGIVYGVCRIVIKSVQQCTYFLFSVNLTEINNLKNDFKQYWYKRNDSPSATGGLQNFFILDS
jgi:hypothetical protein